MLVAASPLQRFAPATPVAVFLLGLCLSAAAGLWQRSEINKDAEKEFQRRVEQACDGVSVQRLCRIAQTAREFRRVWGFGFIQRVLRTALATTGFAADLSLPIKQ